VSEGEPIPHYVLICDDIRREVDGKVTLVGVHSGDFNFNQVKWPNASKSIAIWVKFLAKSQEALNGEIRLFCPEHEAIHARFKFSTNTYERTELGFMYSLNFKMPRGFYTSHSGKFIFQYKFIEEEWKNLTEINVIDSSDNKPST